MPRVSKFWFKKRAFTWTSVLAFSTWYKFLPKRASSALRFVKRPYRILKKRRKRRRFHATKFPPFNRNFFLSFLLFPDQSVFDYSQAPLLTYRYPPVKFLRLLILAARQFIGFKRRRNINGRFITSLVSSYRHHANVFAQTPFERITRASPSFRGRRSSKHQPSSATSARLRKVDRPPLVPRAGDSEFLNKVIRITNRLSVDANSRRPPVDSPSVGPLNAFLRTSSFDYTQLVNFDESYVSEFVRVKKVINKIIVPNRRAKSLIPFDRLPNKYFFVSLRADPLHSSFIFDKLVNVFAKGGKKKNSRAFL